MKDNNEKKMVIYKTIIIYDILEYSKTVKIEHFVFHVFQKKSKKIEKIKKSLCYESP
jgi:phage-related protein